MAILLIICAVLFMLFVFWRNRILDPVGVQIYKTEQKQESNKLNKSSRLLLLVSGAIVILVASIAALSAETIQTYFNLHPAMSWLVAILFTIVLISLLLFIVHLLDSGRLQSRRLPFLRKSDDANKSSQSIEDNEALEILSDEEEEENDPIVLLENALALYEIEISECLIPRKEIIGVELSQGYEGIRQVFIESKHSKLIVYENDMDNISGYVHHSDFYTDPSLFDKEKLEELVREIPAVPATMTALEMLSYFKRKQKSIAWVVDEFGGTEGILTTEDLLEELFGEIEDEHDHSEYIEQQISADEFILSGRLEVEYINDKFDLDLPTESAETLSGYIIEEHNAIPEKDEKIILGPYEFKILKVSKTRIETIRLKIIK